MKLLRASVFFASLATSLLTAAPIDLDSVFLTNIGAGLTPPAYPTFDSGTGAVNALALQPDGKIIAGGTISKYNNTGALTVLKRLNADGTFDATFNSGGTGLVINSGQLEVHALLTESDGKIFVGGTFDSYNGVSRGGLAKLNADGTLDPSFDFSTLGGAAHYVTDIVRQPDGKIIICGAFTSVNGTSRTNIARLNPDGTLDPSFDTTSDTVNGAIRAVAIAADGRIYIGGITYNAVTQRNEPILHRLMANGERDTTFNPVFGDNYGAVSALLLLPDGRIAVGGSIPLSTTSQVVSLAVFNTSGALDNTFAANFAGNSNGSALTLAPSYDGRIFAGGIFTEFSGQSRASITLLNLDGTTDPTFAPQPYKARDNGYLTHIYAIVPQADGRILVGGWFDHLVDPDLAIYNIGRYEGDFSTGPGNIRFTSPLYLTNENSGTATITVARHAGVTGAVSVNYSTATGTADSADFSATSGTLSWTNGEGGLKSFTVPITNDSTVESLESLSLSLSSVTGGATLTLSSAVLSIRDDDSVPAILAQPVNGAVDQGDAFAFSVAYDSVLAATVQWQFNSGSGFANIPGATSAAYKIDPADPALHAGSYRLIITNANGASTSNAVSLTVNIPAGALVGSFNPTLALSSIASAGFDPAGNILAGGSNGLIRLTTGGTVDPSFAPVFNNPVYSVVPLPDGSSLVAGFFTSINSTTRNYFAHINADGTLDATVDFGLNQFVNILSLGSGDKLYLGHGGNQGVKRYTFAGALDATFVTTGLISGNNASVQNVRERADGKVFVAYTNGSSGSTSYQFRLLTNLGAIDSSFTAPTLNWTVYDWDFLPDGRIVIVGRFGTVNGVPSKGIAILNADGSLDTSVSFANAFTGWVNGVRYLNGRLQVWGSFTAFGGDSITGIIRLNLDGTRDTSFKIRTGANGAVNTVLNFPDGRIFVGGSFSTIRDTNRSHVALLEAGPGAVGFAPATRTVLEAIGDVTLTLQRYGSTSGTASIDYATANGTAEAGSDFTATSGTVTWADGDGANKTITVHISQDTTIESSETLRVLLSNPVGNITAASNATLTIIDDDTPVSITLQPVGASITEGQSFTLTGAATSPTAMTYQWYRNNQPIPAATSKTYSVAISGGVDVGSYFLRVTNAAGFVDSAIVTVNVALDPAKRVSSFNFTTTLNSVVRAIAPIPTGGAYIGGDFNTVTGLTSGRYLFRVEDDGSVNPTFNPSPNSAILAMERQADGKLIVAGSFSQISGASRNYLTRLNADGSLDTAFNANLGTGPNSSVSSLLLLSDGRILIGGGFSSVNAKAGTSYIAMLNADGSVDTSFVSAANGAITTMTAQADGKILLGGIFSNYSGAYRLVRIDATGARDTSFGLAGVLSYSSVFRILILPDNRIAVLGASLASNSGFEILNAADGSIAQNVTTSSQFYDGVVQDNGSLFTVGSFSMVSATRLARFAATGSPASYSLDKTMATGTGLNNTGYTVKQTQTGQLWIGGTFTTYNGVTANRLVKLNGEPVAVTITGQPLDIEVNPGATLNFTVTALGTDTLTYQWRKTDVDLTDGGRISGATSAALSISGAVEADEGDYTVVATNATASRSVTSDAATAVVLGAPEILVAPASGEFFADTTLTLSATVRGVAPLTYEWRRNGQLLSNGGRISGADTTTLAISSSAVTDGGIYTLTVINSFGTVSTEEFNISVLLQPGARVAAFSSLSANGAVNQILILPDGGALIAGEFTSFTGANGTSGGSYLVRVKANGEIDPTFTATPDNRVLCLALAPDGGVIVSGYFSNIGGVAKSRLARLTASYTVDSGWVANSSLAILQALAIDSTGRIYVGSTYGGYYYDYLPLIERFSASGEKDTSFSFGGNSYIYHVDKLLIDSQDRVLVAGLTNPGTGSRGLVRLLPTGNHDPSFSSYTAAVSSLSLQADNSIIVGSSTNPTLRRLTPDGAFDNTFTLFNQSISDIAVLYNDRIIAVGSGITNNSITGIARFNADGTIAPLLGAVTGMNSSATTIAVSETGTLWIGGSFTTYNGAPANRILVLNGDVPNLHLVTQPKSQVIDPGTTATFTARAVGTSAISYQWFKDGSALVNGGHVSGVTTTTLTLSGIAASDTGNYTVQATNDTGGTQTSTVASLLVRDLPVALSPLQSLSLTSGSSATFTIGAEGVNPLSYQWNKNGVAISGATGTSYTIPSINRTNAGLYSVTITNALGSATSESAALSVGTLSGYSPVKISSGIYDQFNVFAKMSDGRYYVGGSFGSVAGHNTFGLARFNADGTVDTTFVSPFNGGTCSALAAFDDGRVFVFGLTGATSYVPHTLVNANGTRASFTSTALNNIAGTAQEAAIGSDGNIYVSYNYAAGGNNRAMLVKLSPTGDVLAAFNGDGTGGVYDFGFLSGNRIAIAGNWIKNSASRYVDILDASFVPDTAFAAAFSLNNRVFDLAVLPDGDLMIGGQFSLVNGVSRNFLARINQDGTTDTSFLDGLTGPNSGGVPDIVPTGDGKLLILSSGTQFNGTVVNNFVRISETGVIDSSYPLGTAPNIGLTVGNLIAGLVRNDDAIVLAGYNMTFKGTALGGLGYLSAPEDGTLQIVAAPAASTRPANSKIVLTVAARGAGPLTFQWSKDGSPIPAATGPSYTIPHLNMADEGLYTVTVTSGANSLTSATASVLIGTATPVDTFVDFLANAGVPVNQRGPNDDPDGDGASNLLEYALALNPMVADSSSLPEVLVVNNRLTMVYEQARNDVTYLVETTTDLANPASWTTTGVDQGTPDGDSITAASVAMTSSAHFLRLKVER